MMHITHTVLGTSSHLGFRLRLRLGGRIRLRLLLLQVLLLNNLQTRFLALLLPALASVPASSAALPLLAGTELVVAANVDFLAFLSARVILVVRGKRTGFGIGIVKVLVCGGLFHGASDPFFV